ncbi:histidinol-phosphatase HisJ family protein [Flammeovirga pectinis]|uniref:Histidinol-phosphatase n=1 Tax=Flammeovirga pectinis TaxID=2494373 RepID=A0A3S9NZT3_9BACT|nr:histidinol-phosphatase [Flammeovirga pectinis]AZQ61436.1 histidinol-phosphatase HisJ family protein [Flammeovirga pectinis]
MKPAWTVFHTHTLFCDGKSQLEQYIEAAIELGIKAYGFSSHSPVPFDTTWNMKREKLNDYLKEIERLKDKYKGRIQIYAGLEVDYVPEECGVHSFPQIDYSIGSVHFVEQNDEGEYWEIDNTKTIFRKGLKEVFEDDIKAAVEDYIALNIEMLQNDTPDVLGHLDKIKMHNTTEKLFDENDKWYQDLMTEYLEEIKASKVIAEVNTRGLYKGYSDLYPSPWVLKRMKEMKIPITLQSDAHTTGEILKGFTETAKILKEIGFTELHSLWDNKWQPFNFDERGLFI